MRRAFLLLVFAGSIGGCAGTGEGDATADAGTAPADPLASRLEEPTRKLRSRGYTEKEDQRFRGFLIEGKADVHAIELRSGRCATVVAATSEALTSLELLLYDGGGTEVARADAGAHPVIHYCPSRAGAHYFVVRAAQGNGLYATRGFDSPPGIANRLDDLFGAPAHVPESSRSALPPSPP